MKRTALMAVAGLLMTVAPIATVATQAGAQGGGQVTLVNAASYDDDEPFTSTICVDDVIVDDTFSAGDIIDPDNWAAGTYDIEYFFGTQPDCTSGPSASRSVVVADGDDITIAVTWPSDDFDIVVWPNNNDCLPVDEARPTIRHGADTSGQDVNVFATYGGAEHEVVSDLPEGGQDVGSSSAPATYEGINVRSAVDDGLVVTIGDQVFMPGVQYVIYLYGGADGSVGYFMDEIREPACPTPTTTVITTTTTAAQAVAVTQPRFTG